MGHGVLRLAAAALALAVAGLLAQAASAQLYTFVSAPDVWNADVGDVRSASGWDPGEPNSINRSWRRATDAILRQFAAHSPSFVLVPGDLVGGHWDNDADGLRTFGSVATVAGKRRAIRQAARIYYGHWKSGFRRHELPIRPGLGDHSLGDNPWTEWQQQAVVPTFRDAWADAFTHRGGRFVYARHPNPGTQHAKTAYAWRRGPVFFATVDVLHRRRSGDVHLEVVGSQLRWLRQQLAGANADPTIKFLIVQGHVPVLRPERGVATSALRIEGGASSAFWQTLVAQDVDVYLCGEFHAVSAANRGGVEQLVHGSVLGWTRTMNYLSVRVEAEELRLTLHAAPVRRQNDARLWQVGANRPLASRVVGGYSRVGTMRITEGGRELDRTGLFAD